jgi:hypothetical protein
MHPAWICAALLPALGAQQVPITGEYLESRSNHVFGCYCEWSGEAALGGTEAILAWSIRGGRHQGVDLAGATVAAVLVGDRTLSQGLAPRRSTLFIDGAGSEARRAAAEGFVRTQYRELLGDIAAVHSIPMRFERREGAVSLDIGELLSVSLRKARLPEDALQGAILWYDPFVPLDEAIIATTLNNKYKGAEFDQQWEHHDAGTTGYFGTFRISPGNSPRP